ncbi:MAG: hypothetical protein AB1585_18230 [Thermodesulfobacteriota bacterium]
MFIKNAVLFILMIGFSSTLSCTNPTGSDTSSGSGTGTGWTVTVTAFPTSISSSRAETSGIIVLVKDETGSPATKGTTICVIAQRGGFMDSSGSSEGIPVSVCESITNDLGQMQITYVPLKTWEVEVSPGEFKKLNLPIGSGPDTISASANGKNGSVTIQVVD